MYDQLGAAAMFAAVVLSCLYCTVRALMGPPTIHETNEDDA